MDDAYCYRWSSVVHLSVGMSVTIVTPTKTAESIEVPFAEWTLVGPSNHALDGGRCTLALRGEYD